ncbi:glutathione S-transferase [Paraburkholderia sp. BL27I4N3]|uniref:glutathione S-transferase family protein n=1 Tax=Paraburkholderia sp. BL27I4N3 TaxID=1938805 RepID=UPI000E259301|nr:glutathione S-transferase family protein [Paraburkholderia sp. BL27I4N3]REE07435.1 glutathione S-transferase [Paraburkholderia sp. BL27I4N3]
MKLFWSSRSPFVFKIMVVASELGIESLIEKIPTVVSEKPPLLLEANPLGQIPTLVRNDGRPLADSPVICEYLEVHFGEGRLFPNDPEARWQALAWQSLADGMIQASLLRNKEISRAADASLRDQLRATLPDKVERGMDRIERDIEGLSGEPFGIAQIAIGSALAYVDFRSAHIDWRSRLPKTASWMAQFYGRPSVAQNALYDERSAGPC